MGAAENQSAFLESIGSTSLMMINQSLGCRKIINCPRVFLLIGRAYIQSGKAFAEVCGRATPSAFGLPCYPILQNTQNEIGVIESESNISDLLTLMCFGSSRWEGVIFSDLSDVARL